jgi:ribosome-binding protein aMBF1 (putative translation factor)
MSYPIQILGFTESHNECDRCGKTELKGTYAIDIDGAIMYLGSSCISHRFGMSNNEVGRFITSEKKRLYNEKNTALRLVQKEMDKALEGIDFWEDMDEYEKIEKPFKDRMTEIINRYNFNLTK